MTAGVAAARFYDAVPVDDGATLFSGATAPRHSAPIVRGALAFERLRQEIDRLLGTL